MSAEYYTIRDDDTEADVPVWGCVHQPAGIGWCDLCARYRRITQGWCSQRAAVGHAFACERHTPLDLALRITELGL